MVSNFQNQGSDVNIRKQEKSKLLDSLRNQNNTFAFGPYGIGKTTLVKEVSSEYQNRFGQAVYIDCSLYKTTNAILREILISLNVVISSKNNYDLIKRLKSKIKNIRMVLILDHFDHVNNMEILDIILCIEITVLIVSDTIEKYRRMPLSVKSRTSNIVEIKEFSSDKMMEIIRTYNAELSDEIIQEIINKTGNLSLAVNVAVSMKSIPLHNQSNYLEQLFSNLVSRKTILNEDKNLIMEILKENKRLLSGKLYNLYCEKSPYPKCDRAYRKYMQSLCLIGFVKAIGEKRNRIYEFKGDQIGQ